MTAPASSPAAAAAAAAEAADAPASDASSSSADDGIAAEFPWVDAELLYVAVNADGKPVNCQVEAQGEKQQCLLAFEVGAAYTVLYLPGTVLHLPGTILHLPGTVLHLPGIVLHVPGTVTLLLLGQS